MLPLIPLALSVAPEIAKWLFGSRAEKTTSAVAQAVETVTGVDPRSPDGAASAEAALAGKPELAAQLRVQLAQIAATAEKEQREADQAALMAQFADISDARQQTVALAQTHSYLAYGAAMVSIIVLVTFGVVMWLALTEAFPEGSETILNMLLGTLAAMATSVVSYWVGSSAGSVRKEQQLAVRDRSQ